MTELALHSFHESHGAHFQVENGAEVVRHYEKVEQEHKALTENAAILDLSFRSRACLVGNDRARFLHGQVTNDIKSLAPWGGCYSALTSAKGKMQSDLNIYRLEEELLLDFEPGLQRTVTERLQKYIVADDVEVVDVSPLYGLLSVQGPHSEGVLSPHFKTIPTEAFSVVKSPSAEYGEIYLINRPRTGTKGFDLFVPMPGLNTFMHQLMERSGEKTPLAGWQAMETARVEAGIPRFTADMDETHFPQECGIEKQAVSYNKGCYIGQETLNRIHTLGHVNRALTGLVLPKKLDSLPAKGCKFFEGQKEAGYLTSAVRSIRHNQNIALGYLRNEFNQLHKELTLRTEQKEYPVQVAGLPFQIP